VFPIPFQIDPEAHLAYLKIGTGVISWGESGRSVELTTYPHVVLR
jgi:hypothetical protein